MDMWHSYRRGPLHSQGLASWAVDWRSGVLEEGDRAALKHHMRSYQASFETSPRVLDSDNYAEFLRRPRDLFEVRHVHLARGWTPLWTYPTGQRRAIEQREYTMVGIGRNRCSRSDVACSPLKARVLEHVAHLTDFTCDVQDFLETFNKSKHDGGPYPFELEQTGISIHARASVDRRGHPFHHLRWITPYHPQRHSWRLSILGVANDAQLCLVPPTAVKGDLIVAVAPGMLPMLIHPILLKTTTARPAGCSIPRILTGSFHTGQCIRKDTDRGLRYCCVRFSGLRGPQGHCWSAASLCSSTASSTHYCRVRLSGLNGLRGHCRFAPTLCPTRSSISEHSWPT
jgi:hypothetical protein